MKRLALLLALAGCAAPETTVRTVPSLDLARYQGVWHEVARYPNRFEDGTGLDCVGVTATYAPLPNGKLSVINRCINAADGNAPREARGQAYVVEGSGNARLRVSFFWPFYGDYWVLGLAPDYAWAVVGDPARDYLWVLSRTATLPPAAWEAAVASAVAQGFDPARLKRVAQPAVSSVAR